MVDDKKNLAKKLKTGKKHERQHKTKNKNHIIQFQLCLTHFHSVDGLLLFALMGSNGSGV